MTTYYKVLAEDGSAFHGGSGQWSLPPADAPGEWMPRIEHVVPCHSGYHVCEASDLVHWLGPAIFEVEVRGEVVREPNKSVVHEARLIRRLDGWNETTARLFAIDCATRALNREKRQGRTPDPRTFAALKAARRFAKGAATYDELKAAWSAARLAAESAARLAAESAARSAEQRWQTKRLMEYATGKRTA